MAWPGLVKKPFDKGFLVIFEKDFCMASQFEFLFFKIRIGRFLFLLISLMLWLVIQPFLDEFINISTLMDIFITVILISAVYAVSQKRVVFIAGILLAITAVIIRWTSHFLDLFPLEAANNIVSALFLGFTIVIILNYLFSEKRITADIIMGAICVYFLMGLMWAMGYSLLEMFDPGSFQIPQSMDIAGPDFGYYSFVTLTTLGYGDITPLSGPAQSLSTLEAAMGQLYLAVLVARLVGVHISQSRWERYE